MPKFELLQYQDDFVFHTKPYPAMVASWGTGKTLCGILRAMVYSENIPNNLGVIFRKEYTDLRDSTLKDFKKYTDGKVEVTSQREATLGNGSQILFRHLEELNNIQNMNLGWFFIEQAEEMESDNEFWILWGRMRREVIPSAQFKEWGLPARGGWIIANQGASWIKRLWKDKPEPQFGLVTAQTKDNPYLPADFINNLEVLKRQKPELYERYVLNSWDVESNRFVIIRAEALDALEGLSWTDTDSKCLVSGDPSAGGDEAVFFAWRGPQIIDTYRTRDRDTIKLAANIEAFMNDHDIVCYAGDSIGIGRGICDWLRRQKHKVIYIESAEKAADDQMYYNRRAEMWGYAADQVNDKKISYPQEEEVRRQLTAVQYKIQGGRIKLEPKLDTKKRLGRSPDDGDAWVYGVWARQFVPDTRKGRKKRFVYELTPETV